MTDLLLHRTCPSVGTLFKSIKKRTKFWGEKKNLNENRLSSHLKENKFNLVSLMSSFTWWAGSLLTRGVVPLQLIFFLFTREPRKSKVQSSFPSTAMMHREEKHGQDQKGKKVRRSSRGLSSELDGK
jgi:predicted PurR-regulated permease PerM